MLIADENNIEFFIFYRLSTNDNFDPPITICEASSIFYHAKYGFPNNYL